MKELNNEKGKPRKTVNINSAREVREKENEPIFDDGSKVKIKWCGDDLKGTGWKAGWYTACVKSSDPLQDQIVIKHVSEPGNLYTLDVSPMIADGSLTVFVLMFVLMFVIMSVILMKHYYTYSD